MASNEAHDPRAEPSREPGAEASREPSAEASREPIEDALGRLEERLDRASQAAERLLADAAERVTARDRSGKPPPAGWQQPAPEGGPAAPLLADADLLLGLFGALRDRIPPELQQRLGEALREVLLALRALIDWYLERTDRAQSGPATVEDIPIL